MTNPMREALEAARDDLERVAVDGDDFADTITKIDAALSAVPAPVSEEEIARYQADWLVDAVAGATQDRRLLRDDPTADHILIEAIFANGKKAIKTALSRLSRTEGEWRPIETAPKDEYAPTLVLDGGEAYMAELVNAKAQIWTQLGTGCDCEHPRRLYPTHWMPLPSPPSELSGTITSGEVQSNAEAVVPEWRPDPKTVEAQRDFVEWVDTWVSNPVTGYSVYALDGLFGMARDKIAAIRSLSNQTSAEKE